MRNPERWGRIFVFVATTIIMAVIGLWLAWVRDTERWDYLAAYFVVLGFLIWKLWDYRPPPL